MSSGRCSAPGAAPTWIPSKRLATAPRSGCASLANPEGSPGGRSPARRSRCLRAAKGSIIVVLNSPKGAEEELFMSYRISRYLAKPLAQIGTEVLSGSVSGFMESFRYGWKAELRREKALDEMRRQRELDELRWQREKDEMRRQRERERDEQLTVAHLVTLAYLVLLLRRMIDPGVAALYRSAASTCPARNNEQSG